MKKWFSAILLLAVMSVPMQATAQEISMLNSVSISILPEYDQPSVLVITQITLPGDTPLPARLALNIPSQAEVYAVAMNDPINGLINAPYERLVSSEKAILTISTNFTLVQVEYYIPFSKNGFTRHFIYNWASDYGVESFLISVQEPVNALGLVTEPPLTTSTTGQDGLIYFQSEPKPLLPGETYTLDLQYQKTSDELSTTGLPVESFQPLDDSTPGKVSMHDITPWSLGMIALALIVVGLVVGFYFYKNGMLPIARKNEPRGKKAETGLEEEIYCSNCGKRAQEGDRFCRNCGTQLQEEGR